MVSSRRPGRILEDGAPGRRIRGEPVPKWEGPERLPWLKDFELTSEQVAGEPRRNRMRPCNRRRERIRPGVLFMRALHGRRLPRFVTPSVAAERRQVLLENIQVRNLTQRQASCEISKP